MGKSRLRKSKYGGSASVKVWYSQGYHRRVAQVNQSLSGAARRREETDKRHREELACKPDIILLIHGSLLAALTFAEGDALDQLAVVCATEDAWEDDEPHVLPLGEEGMFFSAAGGEHNIWEEFFKEGRQ